MHETPGRVLLLIMKKSQPWTLPFVNFSKSLLLGLVAKYWPRPYLPPQGRCFVGACEAVMKLVCKLLFSLLITFN